MSLPRALLCALAAAAFHPAYAAATDGAPKPGASPDAAPIHRISITSGDGNKDAQGPEKFAARLAPGSASHRLLSTNGLTEILLKGDSVYMQVTDRGMKRFGDGAANSSKSESLFAGILKNVALSAARNLVDHSMVVPLRDTRTAAVKNGEVVVTACNGKQVLGRVEINDSVQTYPHEAAEAFVSTLMQARAAFPACG